MSIKYRLWIQTDVIDSWTDPHDAHEAARAYIEANPEEVNLLHFGAFRSGYNDQPAKPVFAVSGQELIDYLNDVATIRDEEAEEWDV